MYKTKKILLVEDEEKIIEAVEAYLNNSGYQTFHALDGRDALEKFEKVKPDLVILDLMLPIISGEEICKEIRRKSTIPILMLTAKGNENDIIDGFNIGADDYMTKPFSPRELVVRVNNLFRRCSKGTSPLFNVMSWNNDDLEVNLETHIVKKQGHEIKLTPSEFKILSLLLKHPHKIFTREELIESAFSMDFEGYDRAIDSHIKNIRNKIESNKAKPEYIITVRGVGYKFGFSKQE